jgi:hypothetical protein
MKRILLLSQNPQHWIRKRPLVRHEFNTIYDNTGNLVWQYAIAKILHHPSNQISIERHPYNNEEVWGAFTNGSPEAVNNQFDHVVFSGANMISRRQIWRLERIMPLLSGLRVPFTVCSIGAQADHNNYHLLQGIEAVVKKFVALVLDRSPSIGVRGVFTAEYLSGLGFGNYVKVIGCPSFYMRGKNAAFASPNHVLNENRALIGDTPRIRAQLFRQAAKIFKNDFNVVSQSYVEEDAELDVEELVAIRMKKLYQFTTFHRWQAFAQAHSVSLSGRIHGTVVALHAGIPAILIAVDKRTEELGQHLGVPSITVAKLYSLSSRQQLLDVWRQSKVQKLYTSGYSNFIGYLNHHRLTHWELQSHMNLENYYDGLLESEDASAGINGSLVTYSANHLVYSPFPGFLWSKAMRTVSGRVWASMKRRLKECARRFAQISRGVFLRLL